MLVGESNPYGGDPDFALYPAPDGCSGHRLCCLILGMRRSDYMREFSRRNLCDGPWHISEARQHAVHLLREGAEDGRRFILLGSKVASAWGLPFRPFEVEDGMVLLPHPSGLCRLWNEPGAFLRARALVAREIPWIAHLLGTTDLEVGE